MGGHSLPPGQLCGGWPPKGPIHHPGGHTKTSLSSTGVGHQREGRSGRAREEGGKAGRKEEDRRKQNGEEEEPRALAHMPVPGSGNRDYACLSPRQTTACHQTSPLLHSQWFWPSNPHQLRVKERSPDPQLTAEHLMTWSANPMPSQAGTCASTEGTSSHSVHQQEAVPNAGPQNDKVASLAETMWVGTRG